MTAKTDTTERIDYDDCLVKHFVRLTGWLPACQYRERRVHAAVSDKKRAVPLKYFTFCAANAIDVFMLARTGLIRPADGASGFPTVHFCERDPREFERTVSLVGQNGLMGKFEQIALFKDDADTVAFTLDDNPPQRIRSKLQMKQQHEQLKNAFPFDVINLDMNGVFFPPKKNSVSPMLSVVRQILDWQKRLDAVDEHDCDGFTLLLTSHVSAADMNTDAIGQLLKRVKLNLEESERFRNAYIQRFGNVTPEDLIDGNFAEFFVVALPKVLVRDALERGWQAEYRGVFLYERVTPRDKAKYHMMSSVTHFQKTGSQPSADDLFSTAFANDAVCYEETTSQALEHGFYDCDACLKDEGTRNSVQQDLHAIRAFRDKFIGTLDDDTVTNGN